MSDLNLGILGNCIIAALVDTEARIVWGCLPRLDGDPVFCALLDNGPDPERGGYWSLTLPNGRTREQAYLPNTAVLRTVIGDAEGNAIEILDFAPRHKQYGRMYRPPMLVRCVRPLSGRPRIVTHLLPRFQNGELRPNITRGSNHARYVGPTQTLRLTTDAPLSYVLEHVPFLLDRPMHFVLGPDEILNADVAETAGGLLTRTRDYWRDWARSLTIPFEWQDEVIRAAVTLKLCAYEETGAVVAALTTSIPEAAHSQRNWDYRFCWLRDAYFVIQAMNRLGVTTTMEAYIGYIMDIVGDVETQGLGPLFAITRSADLSERIAPALAGYRGMGPVRIGNEAWLQVQNDVYGSVVLAATHVFFDRRLELADRHGLFEQLERIGSRAVQVWDQPDAGLWELRTREHVHTFSAVMCWAACDRLAKIAGVIGRRERSAYWRERADAMHARICAEAWNEPGGYFASCFGGEDLDASLLLLNELDFLAAEDPRFAATVDAIGTNLRSGDFLYRYQIPDDFGRPETAFTVCAFWYVEALTALGRRDEARDLFGKLLARRNPLGLLSEDLDWHSGEQWGNFPQTYSMVGLINCAMRLSIGWEEAF